MKRAYPNFIDQETNSKPAYNLNKWLQAMQTLYLQMHKGASRDDAFSFVTNGWGDVEKFDFTNWMRFYEGGNHQKYKQAQFYINDNIPGYFLPNPKIPSPIIADENKIVEKPISEPISVVQKQVAEEQEKADNRILMEEQRKRIISRLNAAIKHLTAREGHLLAGQEFERLLSGMYDLIKQFQTVNKVTASGQLYKDLIIREANRMQKKGFDRSHRFLTKLAQNTPGGFDFARGPMPVGSRIDGNGNLGNNQPPVQDLMASPPTKEEPVEEDPLDELLENLETGGLTDNNAGEDEENLEVDLDDDLIVEAQVVPSPEDMTSAPERVPPRPVSEMPEEENDSKKVDDLLYAALENITVQDVVDKLESIISIFKNRQLSRELAILDLMLHKLGLSSLFGELGESSNKLFESTFYISSRLEKIESQLRSALNNTSVDLDTAPTPPSPEAQNVQSILTNNKDKEKERKEIRKQIENQELDQIVTEQPEDLAVTPAQEIQQSPQPQVINEAPIPVG